MPLLSRFNSRYNQVMTDTDTKKPAIENSSNHEEMKIEIESLDKQKELYNKLLLNHRKETVKKMKNDFIWSDTVVVFASLIMVGINITRLVN